MSAYPYALTGFRVGFYKTRTGASLSLFEAIEELPLNARQYVTIGDREYVIERRDQKGE